MEGRECMKDHGRRIVPRTKRTTLRYKKDNTLKVETATRAQGYPQSWTYQSTNASTRAILTDDPHVRGQKEGVIDEIDVASMVLFQGSQRGGLSEDILDGILSLGSKIRRIDVDDLDRHQLVGGLVFAKDPVRTQA